MQSSLICSRVLAALALATARAAVSFAQGAAPEAAAVSEGLSPKEHWEVCVALGDAARA
jgi:hypothetical protein